VVGGNHGRQSLDMAAEAANKAAEAANKAAEAANKGSEVPRGVGALQARHRAIASNSMPQGIKGRHPRPPSWPVNHDTHVAVLCAGT
jgi:hypothetical protein